MYESFWSVHKSQCYSLFIHKVALYFRPLFEYLTISKCFQKIKLPLQSCHGPWKDLWIHVGSWRNPCQVLLLTQRLWAMVSLQKRILDNKTMKGKSMQFVLYHIMTFINIFHPWMKISWYYQWIMVLRGIISIVMSREYSFMNDEVDENCFMLYRIYGTESP